MGEKVKKIFERKIVTVVIFLMALLILALVLILFAGRKKNAKEMITTATLEEMIEISELSTYEAFYNGVTQVMNKKKPEKVDYYVSYESVIKAGIDFEQITISVDHESKKVSVTLPPVEIMEIDVKIESLDFIFENKKANDEDTQKEAFVACQEDAKAECDKEGAIRELARQNAENAVEALIVPFITQVDDEFTLEMK